MEYPRLEEKLKDHPEEFETIKTVVQGAFLDPSPEVRHRMELALRSLYGLHIYPFKEIKGGLYVAIRQQNEHQIYFVCKKERYRLKKASDKDLRNLFS